MKKFLLDIRRFFYTVLYSFKEPSYGILLSELNKKERDLFFSMPREDRIHSFLLLRDYKPDTDDDKLIYVQKRVIIFHDIGKRFERPSLIKRILRSLRFTFFKNDKVYFDHALLGSDILKSEGFSDEIVDIVRRHHTKSADVMFLKKLEG
ncbi:HDIG domain-containing metalloprotein [Thermodesulfobium sp.]